MIPETYVNNPYENKISCTTCPICNKRIDNGPLSICFDPMWETNIWGGDTHDYICFIHQECFDQLLKKEHQQ